MEQPTVPTRAYDLLEPLERQAVDSYVGYAISEQRRLNHRIVYALSKPIPTEMVRRSRSLAKPIVRAAIAERLQAAADEEDLSPDRVIDEHRVIAFSNIGDYLNVGNFGDFSVKSLDEIPRHLLAAVRTMRTVPTPYGTRTEIVLHDKLTSLKILTELVGLVAPDQPPALKKYSKPPALPNSTDEKAPEQAYIELLEQVECRT